MLAHLLHYRLLACVCVFCAVASAAEFKIRSDRESGVYAPGENVVWSVQAVNLGKGETAPESLPYQLLSNSLEEVGAGALTFKDGKASLTATRQTPGTLMLVLQTGNAKPPAAGAVFAPEQMQPSLPRPADFAAFWAAKLQEAEAVPLNPALTPEESPNAQVELWQITLDNINGGKVRGQLARPIGYEGEKFPAMLVVQWAGFYPLAKVWATDPAAQGWLTLNILAHDMPVYEPREFYNKLQNSALPDGTLYRDFYKSGNENRDTSYYLGMYLSTVQAVRYLKSRPDWDGRILVVRGGSQGGMLALAAAALNADAITGVMAKVPGGNDLNGEVAGNKSGRPDWWNSANERAEPQKVRDAARYYDIVNFAPMIQAPTLIGIALGDLTCPPPGMFIAANQLKVPQELFIMPSAGHGTNPINPHRPFDQKEAEWLRILKQGKTPPQAKAR